MTCPRILTKEQIIEGLKAGRTLIVDRCDAPELEDLSDLQAQGLVENTMVYYDEQSSAIKWKWKGK